MEFRQGDKVICIDDSLPSGVSEEMNKKAFPSWIKEGEIYTVRSKSGNHVSILLNEIKNPSIHIPVLGGNAEGRFRVERFTKPTERELELALTEEKEDLIEV
jgi:hypothetical protein